MGRVLVADDVKDMRDLLSAILKKAGHQVVCAETGHEVVKVLKEDEREFDLLLLDINMPIVDGIEAMQRIQTAKPDFDGKICFISGSRDKATVLKALSAGGHDYIVKPIDASIVLEKVKKLLGESGEGKFATLAVRAKAELLGLPIPADFWITEISEVHLVFESPIPFSEGGLIEIKSASIDAAAECEILFSCRARSVSESKGIHVVTCDYIGVHEQKREVIRALVMKQIKIDDAQEDAAS